MATFVEEVALLLDAGDTAAATSRLETASAAELDDVDLADVDALLARLPPSLVDGFPRVRLRHGDCGHATSLAGYPPPTPTSGRSVSPGRQCDRMTRRRASSPYPHPPTALVRDLTQRGWRRCDAEALQLVKYCLEHVNDDERLPLLASHAATALAKEPVLAGALMLYGRQEPVMRAAARLWRSAGEDCWPLGSLAATAGMHTGLRLLGQSQAGSVEAKCN